VAQFDIFLCVQSYVQYVGNPWHRAVQAVDPTPEIQARHRPAFQLNARRANHLSATGYERHEKLIVKADWLVDNLSWNENPGL
jgi:hypothetical protein